MLVEFLARLLPGSKTTQVTLPRTRRAAGVAPLLLWTGTFGALMPCLPAAEPLPALTKIEADGESWTPHELARETFADESWRDRWRTEGDGVITLRDGRLVTHGMATIWWNRPLPANLLVELTAACEPPAEKNAANLNLILHARELDHGPYQVGRSGDYGKYHVIPNYIITFTGGFQPGWSRLRRNPGFEILSEEKSTRSEVDRTYQLRVSITDGRIRYWIDGRLVHDARDPKPHPGGHFALRTWSSRVWWSRIRFAELKRAN